MTNKSHLIELTESQLLLLAEIASMGKEIALNLGDPNYSGGVYPEDFPEGTPDSIISTLNDIVSISRAASKKLSED